MCMYTILCLPKGIPGYFRRGAAAFERLLALQVAPVASS
jgi:hypothetical protein